MIKIDKNYFLKFDHKNVHHIFQDEPLGGWFVQRVIDGKEEEAIEYRFTPKYVLKGGQSVTVSVCFSLLMRTCNLI